MLATYIYDSWLQLPNTEESYAKQLEDLVTGFERSKKTIQDSYADRMKRPSQLSLPLESYTGKFNNPYLGTVEIKLENNSLVVKMGEMNAIATAYTQKESIRVEIEPGSGTPVFFKLKDDKVEAVVYEKMEFARIN